MTLALTTTPRPRQWILHQMFISSRKVWRLKLNCRHIQVMKTTADHIRENVPCPVQKWTDIIHAKRSLTALLLNLPLNYLSKCLGYSVNQSKGNTTSLKQSLESIMPLVSIVHAMRSGAVQKTTPTTDTLIFNIGKTCMEIILERHYSKYVVNIEQILF